MEVHRGKVHSEQFECGLCELIANDLENLETHLTTCEIYQCNSCDLSFRNLPDLKTHLQNEHEGNKYVRIWNGKQDRLNREEISCSSYWPSELFADLYNETN